MQSLNKINDTVATKYVYFKVLTIDWDIFGTDVVTYEIRGMASCYREM